MILRKILFVDDDPILRFAVETHLATYNDHFTTITAVDGFDAVQKLKKHPFSLVALDLIMPRMDGVSLVSHIRENYPDIPIIIVSGMPKDKMSALVSASGVVTYLSKPFQADALVDTIMEILRQEADGGIMHDISPSVFLQLMEMDARSCTIRILDKKTDQGGILYFQDGQLMDVRIGELHGMDAALAVFTWDTATVFLRHKCLIDENRIDSDLQPIIMRAAGMKDETDDPEPDEDDYEEDDEDADESNDNVTSSILQTDTEDSLDTEEEAAYGLDDLDDLELPDDLSTSILLAEEEDSLFTVDEIVEEPLSPVEELTAFLRESLEIDCQPEDIQLGQGVDGLVQKLNSLSTSLHLGGFQIGILKKETGNELLVVCRANARVALRPAASRDTILEKFQTVRENT